MFIVMGLLLYTRIAIAGFYSTVTFGEWKGIIYGFAIVGVITVYVRSTEF